MIHDLSEFLIKIPNHRKQLQLILPLQASSKLWLNFDELRQLQSSSKTITCQSTSQRLHFRVLHDQILLGNVLLKAIKDVVKNVVKKNYQYPNFAYFCIMHHQCR
jgi:hypothetical protein